MKLSLPEAGLIILVDKPYGWTSFQVVGKTRWLLKQLTGIKKIKVGHAGTLDPLATGLMVLCAGKMTKQIAQFTNASKAYRCSLHMGRWSPSYDLEKHTSEIGVKPSLDETKLAGVLQQFRGDIEQYPPVFSAKKVDGKRAYEAARKGQKIELKANKVTIEKLELERVAWPHLDLDIECSKGTYIRSLVRDIGETYGSAAVMTALRRTKSGDFKLENAVKVTQLKQHLTDLLSAQ